MKLTKLHLKNFRCFEDLTVEFGKRLTVIIADNGAGKTALLDAIAIGFGRYLTKIPGLKGRASKETDLRVMEGERRAPVLILAWEAKTHDESDVVWASGRKRDGSISPAIIRRNLSEEQQALLSKGFKAIDEFTLSLVEAELNNVPYYLPVVAYYGTNRTIREEVQRRRGFRKNFLRFDALDGALEPDARFRSAFEWFNAMEDEERRERQTRRDFDYRHPDLEIVRQAIERVLHGYKKPRTEIRPLRFVIDRVLSNGEVRTLRVSQLSDGYRVVLGVVMDLARRMSEANCHSVPESLQGTSPLDMPAIALIDEVDLHLHPRWQQRIVTDLMQTFTNTQFILTTHSPQVLSTVKRDNIRVIGADGGVTRPLVDTYGEPSGSVMHSVMQVDQLPPIGRDDLQRLTEWVDQGQYHDEKAVVLMQSLIDELGESNSQLQRLQRSIARQEALKR